MYLTFLELLWLFSAVTPGLAVAATPTSNEASYNWPASQDGLVLAHNAIRKEISDMYSVLQTLSSSSSQASCPDDDDWQWQSFRAWWQGHVAHVRAHGENESQHLFPAIAAQVPDFVAYDPHEEDIPTSLATIDRVIQKIQQPPQQPQDPWARQLLEPWHRYQDVACRHFEHEEQRTIPTIRDTFAAAEWAPIIRTFFDRGAREEFGSLIHAMGKDRFRNVFMKQRRIPSFVWYLSFQKSLTYYETTMVKHIEALRSGVPAKK